MYYLIRCNQNKSATIKSLALENGTKWISSNKNRLGH